MRTAIDYTIAYIVIGFCLAVESVRTLMSRRRKRAALRAFNHRMQGEADQ